MQVHRHHPLVNWWSQKKELYISENYFNAELPTSVGELGNLTRLFAKVLGSVGAYQKSLVTARSLRSIICPFNAFTGSIPEELADLEAIATIFAEGNKLTGHIPDWIRNRASVRSISLAENMFRGPLPALPLQHLVSFSAETNQLSGSILSQPRYVKPTLCSHSYCTITI